MEEQIEYQSSRNIIERTAQTGHTTYTPVSIITQDDMLNNLLLPPVFTVAPPTEERKEEANWLIERIRTKKRNGH